MKPGSANSRLCSRTAIMNSFLPRRPAPLRTIWVEAVLAEQGEADRPPLLESARPALDVDAKDDEVIESHGPTHLAPLAASGLTENNLEGKPLFLRVSHLL